MDSMRHDLRNALDELHPEAIPATVAVAVEERTQAVEAWI
jgi:predicted lipid carrier protein YhbT